MTTRRNVWIPAHRLLVVVDKDVDRGHRCEVLRRRLNDLRAGRQAFVSLDTADRILVGLGLEHYFHVREEDGGLADIYEDGAQYGRPGKGGGSRPRPYRRKYGSEVERVEARRRTWREAKARQRERRLEDAA